MQSVQANKIARYVGVALLMGLATEAMAESHSTPSGMSVLQRWTLGGPGGWDYLTLDTSGKRLFVTRATRVDVLDTESGKITGTIPDTLGVHGVALADDLKRGYTSNGKGDSVTAFDLESLAVIKEIKIPGHNPDAILYEPVGKHVFAFNGKSNDVTVLDASSLAVLTSISVPAKPEFAVDDGLGQIYVNLESEPGQMSVIDTRKMTLKTTWTLSGCASPSGLAIDKEHHRLYSVCDDSVMAVTDSKTGKQIARLTIGQGPDAAAFDVKHKLIFSSNGRDGTLSVIRQEAADHFRVLAPVTTQPSARTMAIDSASGKVYLACADLGPAPAATAEQPHPRQVPLPDTFTIMVVGSH